MSDLQLFILGLAKVIWNFKFLVFYLIIGLTVIGRWEREEKERNEEAARRLKTQRAYYRKYFNSRY